MTEHFILGAELPAAPVVSAGRRRVAVTLALLLWLGTVRLLGVLIRSCPER